MNTKHILRLFAGVFCFILAIVCFIYSTIFLIGYIDLTILHPVPITATNALKQVGVYLVPLIYLFGYVMAFLLTAAGLGQFRRAGSLDRLT